MRASRRLVLTVMCVGYFLVLLDVTIVNVALPQIGAGLGAGVSGLQWVIDGYAVALAALLLAGGTIGDLRGHKRVVLTGLVVFGIASAGCGLAPGTGSLVAARIVQGCGAALALPGTLAIISDAFPVRCSVVPWSRASAGGRCSSSTCRSSPRPCWSLPGWCRRAGRRRPAGWICPA